MADLADRLALSRLETAAREFSSSHRHLEALACLEKALVIRRRLFGPRSSEVRASHPPPRLCRCSPLRSTRTLTPTPTPSPSPQLWDAAKPVGELCNALALSFLQKEDYARVEGLLRRAEVLTERDLAGRAVTYNNWACYLRQLGKLHTALAFAASCIKSGESWSPVCEDMIGGALRGAK